MKTNAAVYQRNNELRTTTYAQGWAITHYLMAAPDRAAKLDSVLGALRRGTPARVAFRAGFPVEQWPQLIQNVKRYLKDDLCRVAAARSRGAERPARSQPRAPARAPTVGP